MELLNLLLAILLLLSTIGTQSSSALVISVTNNATGTPGGDRFTTEIGLTYAESVLANAASFILTTLAEGDESQRKNVQLVSLTITSMGGVAYETNDGYIYMSSDYIGGFSGEVKREFTGVMYHEETHVWQWNGNGAGPGGLIEGVADYVRLKAGYGPDHWVKPGQGDRWDQGYDVTARFLDYCNSLKDGFVGELNGKMKDGYSDSFFQDLLGKTVGELWNDYKAKYN